MAQQRLVAILRPGAGDQYSGGEGALAPRHRQRARQPNAGGAVEGHLLLAVGIGLHRGLRAPRGRLWAHRPGEDEGTHCALAPVAGDDFTVCAQHADVGAAQRRLLEADPVVLMGQALQDNAVGELVGRIQQRRGAIAARADVEHQAQLGGRSSDRALPVAVEALDHRIGGQGALGERDGEDRALRPLADPGLGGRIPTALIAGVDTRDRERQAAIGDPHLVEVRAGFPHLGALHPARETAPRPRSDLQRKAVVAGRQPDAAVPVARCFLRLRRAGRGQTHHQHSQPLYRPYRHDRHPSPA